MDKALLQPLPIAHPCHSLPPLLSLFTGAGFLDLGFLLAGFRIVWHNENNPHFVKAFNYGMSAMGFKNQNIENTTSTSLLRSKQITKEAFKADKPPKYFGIIGGPPCPDFSGAGLNRGHLGQNGHLFGVAVDIIQKLQPTFFLLENVPGLVKTYKHLHYLEANLSSLRKTYFVDHTVLDALDFGIPQERKRVFIIGLLKNRISMSRSGPQKTLSEDGHFQWPKPLYLNAKERFKWPTTSSFGGTPAKPKGIPRELMVGPLICSDPTIFSLPNSNETFTPKSEKFLKVKEGDTSGKSFKRLHRWRYSPAAAYGNNEVHLHPTLPRRLTVREALRIQSVPDDFAFPTDMALNHKFKAIGNGVPVRLATFIAVCIIETLAAQGIAYENS